MSLKTFSRFFTSYTYLCFFFRALADTDADGRMNVNEFSIACKLINLKLRGFEIPKVLPPSLLMSLASVGGTPSRTPTGAISPACVGPPPVPPQPAIIQQQLQQQQIAAVPPARPAIPPQPVLAQQILPQQIVSGPPPIPPQPSILPQTAGIVPNVAAQSYVPQTQPIPGYVIPGQAGYGIQQTAVVKPMETSMLESSLISGISAQPTVVSATPIPTSAIPPSIPTLTGAILTAIPGQIPSVLPTNIPGAIPGITAISTTFPNQTAVIQPITAAPVSVPAPPTTPSGTPSGMQSRSMSISGDQRAPSIDSPSGQVEWTVKGPAKLKYTQLFNSLDKTRSGLLTGTQARGILMQSKLPQMTLANIWSLSDMDQDGRLGCEEFVLAMYLCDLGLQGEKIPTVLPLELIPPSFRNKQIGSKQVSRAGSVVSSRHGSVSSQGAVDLDPSAGLPQSKSLLNYLILCCNQTYF